MPRGLETLIGNVRRHGLSPKRPPPAPLTPVSKLPAAARLAVEGTIAMSGLVLLAAWVTEKVAKRVKRVKKRKPPVNERLMAARFEDGLLVFESFNMSAI